ncbi:hypothetical protein TUMEXPCC7403_14120 [Tumidithrix helvetica PCC 7403]|uniref:ATP-dependent nuclease n=1 Tax=Tumidithrix helvetica TaxID=3457545 RepID=UPI003C967088
MKLSSVRLINFRCFQDSGEIPFQKFSILIGKNDGGKSSLLYAIQKTLDLKDTFSQEDCRWLDSEDDQAKRVDELEVRIRLVDRDDNKYHIRAVYSSDGTIKRQLEDECVGDESLDDDFESLNLNALKELCQLYSLDPQGAKSQKITFTTALTNHRNSLPKSLGWRALPLEVSKRFPKIHLYQTISNIEPDKVIKSTLESHFKENLLNSHKESILSITTTAQEKLNEQAVNQLLPALKEHCTTVKNISVEIGENSFSNLTVSEVKITQENGRPIDWSRIGSGKKREMSLGIFRWQQTMLTDNLSATESTDDEQTSILALFDEPDVNLDYQAQHLVSHLLQKLADFNACQVLVATHSLNLMDTLPIHSLTFFDTPPIVPWRFEDGNAETETIERVLTSLGVRNSALFNERLMLVFEGQTEINVFDILYASVTGFSLRLSGIYAINGQDNKQALDLAKLLKKGNRRVVCVLDSDCRQNPALKLDGDAVAIKQKHSLILGEELFFLGSVELEDLFDDSLWVSVLNCNHPQIVEGQQWKTEDIAPIRGDKKFSKEIEKLVEEKSSGPISKPELGTALAKEAVSKKLIPQKIVGLIEDIQRLVPSPVS